MNSNCGPGNAGEAEERLLREQALKLLGQRPHSCQELQAKLVRRGFASGAVETVLAEMKARGYLDDREYGRLLLERRIQGKSYGRHAAWRELRQKGVDAEIARHLVNEIDDLVERQAAMKAGRSKKQVLEKRPGTASVRLTVGRHLERRGFPAHIVQGVLEELFTDAEDV